MKMTSQNEKKYPQYIENNNNHCQTFVYNTDEISLEALLDPNFRPMTTFEQPPPPQIYYETYQRPERSWSTIRQPVHYERASFDPFTDLPATQPFFTMPTRRRHRPVPNNFPIIHL
jgi:hypothetical protein